MLKCSYHFKFGQVAGQPCCQDSCQISVQAEICHRQSWFSVSQEKTTYWGPFHKWFFHQNSKSMEILLCLHPSYDKVISTKCCTWDDSCAVVTCAKFCSDMILYNGVTLKRFSHPIWIMMEKSFMNWSPDHFQWIFYGWQRWCHFYYQNLFFHFQT